MDKGSTLMEALRWKGTMADASQSRRRMALVLVVLMSVVPIFTQWGYVGLELMDGSAAYIMFILFPIALCAFLLGTLVGAADGLLVGMTLYLHARIFPLDYYELIYVRFSTSVVLVSACAIVAGLLFAITLREGGDVRLRSLKLGLSCLATSCVFSVGSALLFGMHGLDARLSGGSMALQIVGDALLMLLAVAIGRAYARYANRETKMTGLRSLYAEWLLALVLAAYCVIAGVSYVAITANCLSDGTTEIGDEVEFLIDQVRRFDDYGRQGDQAESSELLENLAQGYSEDADGLMTIEHEGIIVGVDTDRIERAQSLEDALGRKVAAAADASAAEGTLELVTYLGPSETNDLVQLVPRDDDEFGAFLTEQVGYLRAAEEDGFRVVMIRPASMVFEKRDDVVGWVSIAQLVLLAVTYVLSRRLLDQLVARSIDKTNEALAQITGGDLDTRVDALGTSEFVELSDGINATVDSLKTLMDEAEERMEAELATAKAIQESALPSVFPPWPDIQRFDIFASMNAAKQVGGDFYDIFLVGDDCGPDSGKLAFVMADVSGKGVPAALFMMKAKTQLHDYLASGMDVGEAVENANHQLCEGNEEGMFVTTWVGVLDYATWRVEYVNAGHNPPLWWHRGSWSWMQQKSGLPLGLFDEMPYMTYSVDCEVGDQFLLYTDGVTEAFSVDEEQYGEDRLIQLAQDCFAMHPRELVGRLAKSVAAHAMGAEQSDDITILALEVGVPPEEKVSLTVSADLSELENVFDFLHTELDRRLCPVRVQNQLDIAVEELFVNSCRYAYEDADESMERLVRITYSYSAEPRSLSVEIIDDGTPFDPLAKPDAATADEYADVLDVPIGGLGILMAKKNVDKMRYERVGDSNVVTLVKCW